MVAIANLNIASSEFKANPFQFYARLRSEAPVHRITLPDKQSAWLIPRYATLPNIRRTAPQFGPYLHCFLEPCYGRTLGVSETKYEIAMPAKSIHPKLLRAEVSIMLQLWSGGNKRNANINPDKRLPTKPAARPKITAVQTITGITKSGTISFRIIPCESVMDKRAAHTQNVDPPIVLRKYRQCPKIGICWRGSA